MFIKLIRLGKDAELKQLQGGKQVLNFSGAYPVGYGDNERTQWIECAIWGDRAASVQKFMVKGAQVVIYAEDLEVEAYNKNDQDRTAGATLKCTVRNFDFAGGKPEASAAIPAPAPQAPAPMAAPAPQAPVAAPQATAETNEQMLARYRLLPSPANQEMWNTLTNAQKDYVQANI